MLGCSTNCASLCRREVILIIFLFSRIRLTTEAIRNLELELIKKREARAQEKKQKERERQLDREFVEFAHQFRQHKADLKNQQDTPK